MKIEPIANTRIAEILMVEDNEDDVFLTREAFAAASLKVNLHHVNNGEKCLQFLRKQGPYADVPTPDLILLDMHMPVMDGYETITWLRANRPAILPLALTFDASDDAMVRAVRAGARGFVRKDARPVLLRTALDSLMLTGYYHDEELHAGMIRSPGLRTQAERERERVLADITPREMEFLRLVCAPEEFTYDRIADQMGVHRSTVDKFRESLFDKFGIKSKTGLVLFAVRHGVAGL